MMAVSVRPDRERKRASDRVYYAAHRSDAKRASDRAYREANRVALAAYQAVYRAAHHEERNAYQRACRAAHPASNRDWRAAYYVINRDKRTAYNVAHSDDRAAKMRAYYVLNREDLLAKAAADRITRPDYYTAKATRARAVRRQAPGTATAQQIAARWAMWGGLCWMCGVAATCTDHVKPLAKGGSGWASNLRPACGSCNGRKHAKWPLWVVA